MKRRWHRMTLSILVAHLLALTAAAEAATEPQRLVDDATATVGSFLRDSRFKAIPSYLKESRGVLVVPALLRAGIGIGGEGGPGVLLRHDRTTGQWSDPVFVHLRGATLGPQLGVETLNAIFVIMNDDTFDLLLSDRFKLGADATAVFGSQEARTEVAATFDRRSNIYAFLRGSGLYAGASVKGTVVSLRNDWNAAYYGRPVTAQQIIVNPDVTNSGAAPLRDLLTRVSAGTSF